MENTEKIKNEMPEIIVTPRNNVQKSVRIITDFSKTVSRTEQHNAHANDLNVLVKRYTIDDLTMYLASKSIGKEPIEGYDFSIEPTRQEALNEVARLKNAYEELPVEVRQQFSGPLDFLKFVDDPKNAQKLIELGLMKLKTEPQPEPEKVQKVRIINDDEPNDDDKKRTKKT